MDRQTDVFGVATHLNRERRFGDQIPGIGPDDAGQVLRRLGADGTMAFEYNRAAASLNVMGAA